MQKKIALAIAVSIGTMIAVSCNETGSKTELKSKEDSLNLAKAVMEKYPEAKANVRARTFNPATDSIEGINPPEIAWDSVSENEKRYEEEPIVKDAQGNSIKGFTIDAETYQLITGNSDIKGLYLAFGRRADGSYTIMALGLDADGHIVREDDKHMNYDFTLPCPDRCP